MSRSTIIVSPDTNPTRPNRITAFCHCTTCGDLRPPEISPAQWARLSIGVTDDGLIQVWCERCHLNVAVFTIELAATEQERV